MAMLHDNNAAPSYEHLQGTPKKAHEGSQSKSPEPMKTGHPMSMPKGKTQKAHKVP